MFILGSLVGAGVSTLAEWGLRAAGEPKDDARKFARCVGAATGMAVAAVTLDPVSLAAEGKRMAATNLLSAS